MNPLIKLFFYLPIWTNNNLLLKICYKNIAVKFLFFFLLFHFHSYESFPFLFPFFLLVSLLHMSTVQCPISTPFFYFPFLLKNVPDIREEREREEKGQSRWIYRSPKGQSRCSTTTSAPHCRSSSSPPPGWVRSAFFFFFSVMWEQWEATGRECERKKKKSRRERKNWYNSSLYDFLIKKIQLLMYINPSDLMN